MAYDPRPTLEKKCVACGQANTYYAVQCRTCTCREFKPLPPR